MKISFHKIIFWFLSLLLYSCSPNFNNPKDPNSFTDFSLRLIAADRGRNPINMEMVGIDIDSEDNLYISGGIRTRSGFSNTGIFKLDNLGNSQKIVNTTDPAFFTINKEGDFLTYFKNDPKKIKKITKEGVITDFANFPENIPVIPENGINAINSLVVDTSGNIIISKNNRIDKISSSGEWSILAGSPTGAYGYKDDVGKEALFFSIGGIAIDSSGNIFVTDTYNHRIRKITPAGIVTTFAGSGVVGSLDDTGLNAQFQYPKGITIDSSGNLYVLSGSRVRKITAEGVVSTFAGSDTVGSGDGTGTSASFNYPEGITIDILGNLYVADTFNNAIRKISSTGVVSTFLGSSFTVGTSITSLNNPVGITTDSSGNIWVSDTGLHIIRKITPTGVVTNMVGTGTSILNNSSLKNDIPSKVNLLNPKGLSFDSSGNLYFIDAGGGLIRKLDSDNIVYTIFDSGVFLGKNFSQNIVNNTLVLDDTENLYFSGQDFIYKFNSQGVFQSSICGGYGLEGYPKTVKCDADKPIISRNNNLYLGNPGQVRKINSRGYIEHVYEADYLSIYSFSTSFSSSFPSICSYYVDKDDSISILFSDKSYKKLNSDNITFTTISALNGMQNSGCGASISGKNSLMDSKGNIFYLNCSGTQRNTNTRTICSIIKFSQEKGEESIQIRL